MIANNLLLAANLSQQFTVLSHSLRSTTALGVVFPIALQIRQRLKPLHSGTARFKAVSFQYIHYKKPLSPTNRKINALIKVDYFARLSIVIKINLILWGIIQCA